MKSSIRRRLLIALLSVTTLVWLITLAESYKETLHEVEELFDAQLAQSARTLLAVAGHELTELEGIPDVAHIHFLPDNVEGHEYEHKLAYQLWIQPQNKLLMRSFKAPDSALSQTKTATATNLSMGTNGAYSLSTMPIEVFRYIWANHWRSAGS